MNQPLLHVMIPAYGESPYLRQTLESAVKFLPTDVPITVIEDPSPGVDLEKLVKDFPRVQYVRNSSRLGIGGNFNKSIELSSGIFTQICGSDDLFIDNPLSNFDSQNLINTEIAVIGLDVEVINEKNRIVKTIPDQVKRALRPKLKQISIFENKKIFSNLMLGDWLYFPAILWKTEVIKQIKFDSTFHTAMDLDIFIRLINNENKIAFIKKKVLGYRRHDQSASSLYAKSIGRFDEEFLCHKNAIEIARKKNWKTGAILAQLALTVRLHAIMQSFLMVFTSPLSALKVLVKAISPIR
ncbi:MAG: glycosyltransferase family 2 protein [Candidatus Nanopelagicales bacterium]|nr:glycosyltransferase family 2 protein [Candidatus Nanopelagicales bacterium]